ncbi:MAG: porin family protein [Saprospiraceae bacterium]
MENKYIDQFFKDKLEHREIQFSEDAWLAAEQMIEQEERKRRWGGLGRLWFLLPFLVAGVVVLMYQSQLVNFPIQQNGMTTSVPFGAPNLRDNNTATFDQKEKNIDSESTVYNLTSTDQQADNTTTDKLITPSEEGASVVVAGTATLEEEVKKGTTPANQIEQINENKTPSTNIIIPASSTKKKKGKVAPPMASLEKPNTNKTVLEQSDIVNSSNSDLTKNVTPAPIELEQSYEKTTLESIEITSTDYQLPSAKLPVGNSTIRYHKTNRLKAGLMTSTIFTPSFNDQIIGISGMNVGGTFSYRLNSRWSANADLLYEFHGRNFAFENGNNSLEVEYQTFGFGLDDKRLNVKVTQSHLLTLPVYAKYHIGRHSLDLGVQVAYTLGLRGKIEEETISENQIASTRQSKNSWIDSEQVSPFQFNVMMGYQFKISHRWSVGVRSVIVPSRLPRQGRNSEDAFNPLEELGLIGQQNASGERTPVPLFAHNAINFHLGVQYNLNPKVRHITKPLMGL